MLGSIGIGLTIIFQSYLVTESSGNSFSGNFNHSVLTFWKFVLWPLLIPALQYVMLRVSEKEKRWRIISFYTAPFFVVLVLFHSVFSNILYYVTLYLTESSRSFAEMFSEYRAFFGPIYLSRFADLALILIGLFLFNSYKNYNHTKIELAEMESNLKESELNALRNQIQPHFLFNTLNTISALIDQDTSKAQKVLSKTAGFLRVLLTQSDKQLVPLDEELKMITDYLAIETERFNDRLKIKLEIAEDSKKYYLPYFILQPLVENSLKHAVAKSTSPITIHIKSEVLNGRLLVNISDDGPGDIDGEKLKLGGVGLRNVENRLTHIYGENAELEIKTKKGKGFSVAIAIPYSKEN